jgi:hypothetical protein
MTEEVINNGDVDKNPHHNPHKELSTDDLMGILVKNYIISVGEDHNGVVVIYRHKKGDHEGYVWLSPLKRGWNKKPITPRLNYGVTGSDLNDVHDFLSKFYPYDERTYGGIRKLFLDHSIGMVREHLGGT